MVPRPLGEQAGFVLPCRRGRRARCHVADEWGRESLSQHVHPRERGVNSTTSPAVVGSLERPHARDLVVICILYEGFVPVKPGGFGSLFWGALSFFSSHPT